MPNSAWPDGRLLEGALAALGPAQRKIHRALDLAPLGRQPHAFVELHGDVGAEQNLHLDGALRRQCDHGAVEMGAERDALFLDFAQGRKRHHLKTAGIGQDRMRPAHERVQPAERRDPLGRRPQHQMIGVGEQDIGAGRAHIVMMHALDRRLRADRHERRRAHDAVRRCHLAGARGAVGGGEAEGEIVRHAG